MRYALAWLQFTLGGLCTTGLVLGEAAWVVIPVLSAIGIQLVNWED